MKKFLIISTIVVANIMNAATVADLQNQEKAVYTNLSDYWLDEKGDIRIGSKNADKLQFDFSEARLARQSIEQIKNAMNTAIAKFSKAQQDAFIAAVSSDLKELENVRNELKTMRRSLDEAAGIVAKFLGKTNDDVLRLGDQNLANLINKKSTETGNKQDAQAATIALGTLKKMRPAFGLKVADAPVIETEKEKSSSTGGKLAAAANAVAKSETKLSGLVKASGNIASGTPCQNIHFDIVPGESRTGVIFLRLIK